MSLKKYIVGGWVRDKLLSELGHPMQSNDKDWVVTGATPEEMLKLKFVPVGSDFPVFLHPRTHEEYALARTERKSGHGYKGFTFFADPSVTLEQDLLRRHLVADPLQLVHERLVDVQAAGGVEDNDVVAVVFGVLDRVFGDLHRADGSHLKDGGVHLCADDPQDLCCRPAFYRHRRTGQQYRIPPGSIRRAG